MSGLLLGIDIGTSSCKVAAFDTDGALMGQASSDYTVHYPKPGWAEQDPDDWWRGVCLALRELFSNGGLSPWEIGAVGVAGQSWSAVLVDGSGQSLNRTPIWMDTRAARECEEVIARLGEDTVFSVSGNPFKPSYTLPKLLWYQRHAPGLIGQADKVLQSNGYVVFRLTGEMTQDLSQGYGFACFDMKKGAWDTGLARTLGIREGLLPDIVRCQQVVGRVHSAASRETGLLQGTPVVAGGLDAACGTLGAGVYREGQTQEQGGQAGGMSICMERMLADKRLILSRHVVGDAWLLQGGSVGGGGIIRWLGRELYAGLEKQRVGDGAELYAVMDREAESIPPGSNGLVFLPYMAGERSPVWDPDAKGVLFGMDYTKTRAHITRAGMEGTAFSLKHNCDIAAEAGAEVAAFHAIGGAANSRVWTQIKADVTGRTIHVPAAGTATALGASLLAGTGTGFFKDFDTAVEKTIRLRRTHHPNPATRGVYEHNYRNYLRLYKELRGLMKETAYEGSDTQ